MKNEIKYARMLEGAGLDRENAETYLKVIEGAMQDNVATKQDLNKVQSELKFEIQEVWAELKQEIQELRTELKQEIQELRADMRLLERDLTLKMGYMITGATSFLGALIVILEFVV